MTIWSHVEQGVFQALADPTRRGILDALREGPKSTTDLVGLFEMSRYGVMKHLKVLCDVGLVSVQREGRVRWNHLNAVPLREMYQRWLGPYQEFWSTSLLRLRDALVSDSTHIPIHQKEKNMSTFNTKSIQQEIRLNASPEKVWSALTTDIDRWWAYRMGEEGSTLSLDPSLGGRFIERWGDGEGLIWADVIEVRKGQKLRLKGPCGMSGAAASDFCYTLKAEGSETILTLNHHLFGFTDAETGDNFEQGWRELFDVYLKAWLLEGKTAAEIKK